MEDLSGTPVVYTAESLSLAALELLVHLDPSRPPEDLVAYKVEVPESGGPGRPGDSARPRRRLDGCLESKGCRSGTPSHRGGVGQRAGRPGAERAVGRDSGGAQFPDLSSATRCRNDSGRYAAPLRPTTFGVASQVETANTLLYPSVRIIATFSDAGDPS